MPFHDMSLYILDAKGNPIREPDVIKWATWFEENDTQRIIAKSSKVDNSIEVSTVFLGIDHSFNRLRPPMVYETMIFGGEYDGRTWRAANKLDATINHKAACRLCGLL